MKPELHEPSGQFNFDGQSADKVTFLLLHHFGGSARSWQPVMDLIAPDARCLAVDLRGFGSSASMQADSRGYTMSDYADDIAEVVRLRQLNRYVLVGHSMGGKIALAFAARQPGGLSALVLLAPSPPTPEPIPDGERNRLLKGYGNKAACMETLHNISVRAVAQALQKDVIADNLRCSREAWRAWLEHGSREDISACMSQISVPTFVMSGDADAAIPAGVVEREVVERIQGAQFSIVPNAGHLLPLEAPSEVADYLRHVKTVMEANTTFFPTYRYPAGTVRKLLETDFVTPRTKEVLLSRLGPSKVQAPRFFSAQQFITLQAVCARLIPQAGREPVDLAAAVDERLAEQKGDGWRYNSMPPDGEAYRLGLGGLEESAQGKFSKDFASLDKAQQDSILLLVQRAEVAGGPWEDLPPGRFFEELLAELTECYYSDPISLEEIGYRGMADAKGWHAIGLDRREQWESEIYGATRDR